MPYWQRNTAGEYDRLIELRRRVLADPNSQGEQVPTWPAPYAKVWAKKMDLRGQKRFMAKAFSNEEFTEFTIRWRDDILLTDRIVLDGDVYEITNVSEVGRRQSIDMLCRWIAP